MDQFPRIPGFTLTAVLGRGGMAVVYAAIDESLGRKVAIKVVTPHGPDGARHVLRLEQEARGLAALQHPNIVELHSFGRLPDGALYYVMPLMEGGELSSWRKPVPEEQLLPLLVQILDALGHAHEEGLIHRDIKPANILFDRAGRPLLADFGAAFVRGTTRLTQHGMTVGSSHYMSPEQARGQAVDARSDLYSVGVLAFELLSNTLPFDGPDDLSIALAKFENPVPTLPPRFARWQPFFDRALALSPDDRFANAAAMREALRLDARTPPAPWSRRPITIAAGAVLVALVAVAAWLLPDRQVSLADIESAVAQDRLAEPARPNAVDLLQRAAEQGMTGDSLQALRTTVLARLGQDVSQALAADADYAPDRVQAWLDAVDALGAATHPAVRGTEDELSGYITARFEHALRDADRQAAEPAARLLLAWPQAPAGLQALAERVRKLRVAGERFADPGGPPLVVAPASGELPAMAVMTAPLAPHQYEQFASGTAAPCEHAPSDIQACIGHSEATRLADALSQATGETYRLPSKEELDHVLPLLEPAPVRVWTSSCHERRVVQQQNIARRTWSGVRQLFGRDRLPASVRVECDGFITVPLDGADGSAQPTSVLLVRDLAE